MMADLKPWVLYILRCRDGSLYTGVTTDLKRRLRAHNSGKAGAKYTRSRRPVELVYQEPCADRGAALRRERAVKALTREEKLALIAGRHEMINTTLCYLENARGEWLMLHRVKKENDVNRDKWIGVGGKFEPNESPEECLLREVREETGLTLTDYRFRGVVTFVSDRWPTEYMYLFTAAGWTGELPESCDEGDLEWVPKDRVQQLPIWEGDKIFFRLLAGDRPVFLLKVEYNGDTLVRASLDGAELPLE